MPAGASSARRTPTTSSSATPATAAGKTFPLPQRGSPGRLSCDRYSAASPSQRASATAPSRSHPATSMPGNPAKAESTSSGRTEAQISRMFSASGQTSWNGACSNGRRTGARDAADEPDARTINCSPRSLEPPKSPAHLCSTGCATRAERNVCGNDSEDGRQDEAGDARIPVPGRKQRLTSAGGRRTPFQHSAAGRHGVDARLTPASLPVGGNGTNIPDFQPRRGSLVSTDLSLLPARQRRCLRRNCGAAQRNRADRNHRLRSGTGPLTAPTRRLGEKSAPSWAGLLKLVEARLHQMRPEYRLLRVTPTDGHRTWRLPLSIATHLLTEKILSANDGRCLASRPGG
jgi:hypothetical protein